jgi:hypothetical protein
VLFGSGNPIGPLAIIFLAFPVAEALGIGSEKEMKILFSFPANEPILRILIRLPLGSRKFLRCAKILFDSHPLRLRLAVARLRRDAVRRRRAKAGFGSPKRTYGVTKSAK